MILLKSFIIFATQSKIQIMKIAFPLFLIASLTFLSCSKTTQNALSADRDVIASAIKAHGGKKYDQAAYAFEFRGKAYSFKNSDAGYEYTLKQNKNNKETYDVLTNNGFTRTVDGVPQAISAKNAKRYGNALNSVIYFALLPYKLDDPAVKKKYMGITTIKGKVYETVEVSFGEENGGTDHDDVFYYWVNQKTQRVDYLAYLFHVNNGGVRFRSAYNARQVEGIYFQDYVNYKAPKDTPLKDLPLLYDTGKLEELSRIELKNIKAL